MPRSNCTLKYPFLIIFCAIFRTGHIPITGEGKAEIEQSKRFRSVLEKFSDQSKTIRLMKLDRESQILILCKLSKLYHHLLWRCFNEKK